MHLLKNSAKKVGHKCFKISPMFVQLHFLHQKKIEALDLNAQKEFCQDQLG